MKRLFSHLLYVPVSIVLLLSLAACNHVESDEETNTNVIEAADVLYNGALADLNRQNFDAASEKLTEIETSYPYAPVTKRAIVLNAYARFRDEDYEESIAAADRYTKLFPDGEGIDYLLFILGESHFAQIVDVRRDQTAAREARRYFDELATRFPDSAYAALATTKSERAHDQLAGKEMEVGRYYLERRHYIAALNRFREVVNSYETTRHVEEALYRLTEAYLTLGLLEEARNAAALLGFNYPNSSWYRQSYELLRRQSGSGAGAENSQG